MHGGDDALGADDVDEVCLGLSGATNVVALDSLGVPLCTMIALDVNKTPGAKLMQDGIVRGSAKHTHVRDAVGSFQG